MKKLISIVLGLGLGACQHSAPPVAGTNAALTPAPPVAAATPVPATKAVEPLPSLFAAADTLTPAMWEVVRTQDLAPLWQNADDSYVGNDPAMEGFFGPDHYRFAMIFTDVARDAQHPERYRVRGKTHYRKNVRAFTGTLTVRQVRPLVYPGFLEMQSEYERYAAQREGTPVADTLSARAYTARAQLQLQEEHSPNSGIFEAEALLDFYTMRPDRLGYVTNMGEGTTDLLPTRGGRVLVRGNRRNISTGQVKAFAVSPAVMAVAPDLFSDFMLDERMGEINPKYIKQGWNELWQNDEWWADSPKPSLNL